MNPSIQEEEADESEFKAGLVYRDLIPNPEVWTCATKSSFYSEAGD